MKNILTSDAPDARFTSLMPPLSSAEYTELKADIQARGVLVAILKDEFGTTIDGANRERIVAELRAEGHKIPDPRVEVLHSLTDEQKRSIARAVNLARRHLTDDQKKAIVEAELRERPGRSNRDVSRDLGVSGTFVADVRESCSTAVEPQLNTVGADGKSRPATKEVAEDRRHQVAAELEARPDATLRDVAEKVGVSPATVKAVRDEMTAPTLCRRCEKKPPVRGVGLDAEVCKLCLGKCAACGHKLADDNRGEAVPLLRETEGSARHEGAGGYFCKVCTNDASCDLCEMPVPREEEAFEGAGKKGVSHRHVECELVRLRYEETDQETDQAEVQSPRPGADEPESCGLCGQPKNPSDGINHDSFGPVHHECLVIATDAGMRRTFPVEVYCPECERSAGYECDGLTTHDARRLRATDEQRLEFRAYQMQTERLEITPPLITPSLLGVCAPGTPAPSPAPAPQAQPMKPIVVDNPKQLEKIRDLAEDGKLDTIDKYGINGAHKRLREDRRHAELRDLAAEQPALDINAARIEKANVFDLLDSLPDASVDCIWTDAPYFIAAVGGGTKVGDSYETFDPGEWDNQWVDDVDFLDWLAMVIMAFDRVLKPTGNLVLFNDQFKISDIMNLCRLRGDDTPNGLTPKKMLSWFKDNAPCHPRKNFDSSEENGAWAAKPDFTFNRPAGQCPSVWRGPLVSGTTRQMWPHPTAKPIGLIQYHLSVLSNPGDVVLDPFAGSGATVEAALRIGRRVIAGDASEKYADMCRARAAWTLAEVQRARDEQPELPLVGVLTEERATCAVCGQYVGVLTEERATCAVCGQYVTDDQPMASNGEYGEYVRHTTTPLRGTFYELRRKMDYNARRPHRHGGKQG